MIGTGDPIWTPPVKQLLVEFRARGPQRKNVTSPPKSVDPVTVTSAWSLTVTDPVPIESPPAGIVPPAPVCGVVTVLERHCPSWPREKSCRFAPSSCEARVLARNVLKHLPPRPLSVRLIPPSKNSRVSRLCPTVVLFTVSHGV